MRAMACESSVALNPGPAVQHPEPQICAFTGIQLGLQHLLLSKARLHCFSLAILIFSVSLHSALWRTSRVVAECRQS